MTSEPRERDVSVASRLASIEAKLDNVLTKDVDHERRIRWLERVMIVVVLTAGSVIFDKGQEILQALGS